MELLQLLSLLLRVVSPAAVVGSSVPPGPGLLAGGGGEAEGGGSSGGDAAKAPTAVSLSEARALTELLAARGIAQGQLAALLGLEKSTVSRLAAGLERKGWIKRGRDTSNQRYIRLYLTPEGRALAGRVWRVWRSRQAQILARLSEEERVGLAVGLRGLARTLAADGLLADAPSRPEAAPPPRKRNAQAAAGREGHKD
ncbi:MAG TPA: MarR family winged helix-turn-helix transcriptional regulator [Streptosporangiaceae bacterium]